MIKKGSLEWRVRCALTDALEALHSIVEGKHGGQGHYARGQLFYQMMAYNQKNVARDALIKIGKLRIMEALETEMQDGELKCEPPKKPRKPQAPKPAKAGGSGTPPLSDAGAGKRQDKRKKPPAKAEAPKKAKSRK